jgi:hypothetical protein
MATCASCSNDEAECTLVSSRGILKSCDVFPSKPQSSTKKAFSYNWTCLQDGQIIYIQGSAVPDFTKNVLPQIRVRFKLVTGDCDETIPKDVLSKHAFQKFINDQRLIHWYSQNLAIQHPKMTGIPIGLDYHTLAEERHQVWGDALPSIEQEKMLYEILLSSTPLKSRKLMCHANFQFNKGAGYARKDRSDALKQVPKELVYYQPRPLPRKETWEGQAKMTFVLSPHGNGYDCHRTWEALALGCIPIVKTSPIDYLFENLPVLIVQSWADVTEQLLSDTREKFYNQPFHMTKLTLQHWMNVIRT